MAIEKMKLLGITGNSTNLDTFLANVLFKSDVQIEDAKKIYNKGWKLEYFDYDYKIKEAMKKCESLLDKLNIPYAKDSDLVTLKNNVKTITENVDSLKTAYDDALKVIDESKKKNIQTKNMIEEISKVESLDIDMKRLYDLNYIKFRYGSIPKKNLEEIKKEISNLNTILFEIKEEQDNVWIMYFTSVEYVSTIDGIFNIQKFERKMFPGEMVSKPKEYIAELKERINQANYREEEAMQAIEEIKNKVETDILSEYRELQTYEKINTIKKYIVRDQNGTFYVVAWIGESNLKHMTKVLDELKDIDYVVKDGENPPTKLINNKIVKPFETLVKMYGVPRMDELDPTWFVALSTFIMFGFMFGDVGHGLIFFIIGLFLLFKKKSYGAILLAGGLSATIFGFLYGSVFGKEDILESVLISPMNDISTMLVYGIVVGTIFILLAMILNIANGIKNKDLKKVFLDQNGFAGIILYGFVLACVAYYFLKGKMLISTNVIVIVALILVLIIMFNEQISNLIEKKKAKTTTPFVEKIFEIIEMLLSFLSNTISFLRLAAFAINHAGLCMAVYLLADMTSGAGNLLIAILGNVIVLVLEGLIVGIQTLRLEYYELFSRFYDGSGKEYKSIKAQVEEQN